MRRWAPGPSWSGAIVGVALLALAATVPDAGANAAADGRVSAKRKAKPKPVVCRAGQVTITLKGRTRCKAARTGAAGADTRLAIARAVLGANTGTLRAKGGRRIRPIWKSAPGLGRIRTRLLRTLPKVLALTARASTRVPGDPPACANDPRGAQQTSSDGFAVGIAANGDVTMSVSASNGYRVEAFLGGLQDCADLDLPECPTPDGHLDGADGRRTELGVRVTKDGALVQSLRSTLRSRQTLRGTVADDAKLDALDLTDVANETLSFQIPGRTVTVRVALRGSARLNLRSGAIGGARVQTDVGFSGTTAADALSAAGRTVDDYVQRFPDLVRREGAHLTRREQRWQTPGRCAKLGFDPATDALELPENEGGTVTARIEALAGGVAAKARWTVSEQANGVINPATAQGAGSLPFSFLVTRAGQGLKLRGTFRATSTAGVAEETWTQRTKPPPEQPYFKIVQVVYDASYQGSTSGSSVPCAADSSVTEQLSTGPLPFEPPFATLQPQGDDGAYSGAITTGSQPLTAHRDGVAHGCDLSAGGDPPPACQMPIGMDVPAAFGVIVELPATGDAKVTWILPPATAGDGGPAFPCYTPTIIATPEAAPQTVSRDTFLTPGTHVLSVNRGASFQLNVAGLNQSLNGTASAALHITRVNADGSPYTG